ncbi:MATE family efflux transporter [Oscillibacter sp.]|uniref:MATE family efflux transporter n=1 Tax=Oscillibacter sp. TaxID=1945593 RepID=UPI00261E3FB9|nr:MATE family efflux transporter [Oscillibacter sp.]MDD3346896.1 MATE family efflux transporter [Oscillibacter sp.]
MPNPRETTYEIDMCNGRILPKLLQFTVPLICSSILQLLFNAADIVVVGRFAGDTSLAAVGSNTSIIGLLTNLFIGLSVGANILAARFYGADEKENLRQTIHTSILLSLLSGIFLAVLGVCGAKTILVWMQAPPQVLNLAVLYLRIYFLGMPAMMLYNFGAALLRAVGDTRRPLYFLFGAGVVNVVLNLFFVIVWKMDVAGVALATVISQCISAALILLCMMREPGAVHLDLRQLHIFPARLKQILQTGLPAGLQGILFALSNIVIQSTINSFGETVMAGNAAAANLENFVYVSTNAFYQANISFTSQNLGAGQIRRIPQILLRALLCAAVLGTAFGGLVTLFGPQLLGIYSNSPEVVSAGMRRLLIVCTTYGLCGLMDVTVGSLRGIGYSVLPMLVTLVGACGLRLLTVATIFQIPRFHTIQTVYWSYPASWTLTFLVHILCYFWAIRQVKRRLSA